MIMNSLCALALGFALDMMLGDFKSIFYPLNLIEKMVKSLENTLRKAYADSKEAQRAAGGMLTLLTLIICLGVSLGLLLACYKLSVVLGIIVEGILCWNAVSIKSLRTAAQGVNRCAKSGNLSGAKKHLDKITCRDTEDLDMDGIMKAAVECVSENTVDWAAAPIFWMCLLGGLGGVFCRCVNILDNAVGYKTDECRYFGSIPARLDDAVNFIPSRICAFLMRLNVKYLKLDSKNAARIYSRDRKKVPGPNAGQTQSVCAGALGISLGSDEYYNGQLVRKPRIGNPTKPLDPTDVYWSYQLLYGTVSYCLLLAAAVRVGVFLLTVYVF